MGIVKHLAVGATALALVGGTPALANLVANDSFETNGGIGQFNANTTADPWTVAGTDPAWAAGYAFIFSNDTAFTTGSPNAGNNNVALYCNLASCGTTEGSFFYGVDSTFHPSILSQTITGLTPGTQYELTFGWAAAQQQGYNGDTTDQFQVSLGAETHLTSLITLPEHTFSGWQTATMGFTATSGTETLSFRDLGTCLAPGAVCGPLDPGGPPFSLLDSVSLTEGIPEASTWAMVVLGFAGLGFAAYRGRRTAISIV